MDTVEACLEDLQGGTFLEHRTFNGRRRPSYTEQSPTNARSQVPFLDQGQLYTQSPLSPQYFRHEHQSRAYLQPQGVDSPEIPLDAFGKSWFVSSDATTADH